MKKLLLVFAICTTFYSQASMFDAVQHYDEKNYALAFKEYNKFARLGNIRAQYNLAIMRYYGQGTEKDLIKAYAWTIVAGDKDPAVLQLRELISKTMNDVQMAKDLGNNLKSSFSHENAKEKFGPIDLIDNEDAIVDYGLDYQIILNKKTNKKLKYPNKALKKSGRGWVELSYNIYPDGTVRDINITEQFPHKLFAPSAIEHIAQWKFDFIKNGEPIIPKHNYYTSYRARYGIEGISGLLNRQQKNIIKEKLNLALKGSLEAQYRYTQYYYTYLLNGGGVSEKIINKWLFRSAQFGIPQAMFKLGKNIFYGKACKQEKQKGLDWIIRSAQSGNAEAQYLSYHLLTTENLSNNFEQSANYWLQQSALNNSEIGKIKYVKQILSNNDSANFSLANKYLEEYAEVIGKTADWYQTHALLLSNMKDFSGAQISLKKAIKLAKKSHWSLIELEQQMAMILKHKKEQ